MEWMGRNRVISVRLYSICNRLYILVSLLAACTSLGPICWASERE